METLSNIVIKFLLISNSKQLETKELVINEINIASKNYFQEILVPKENDLAIFISTVQKQTNKNLKKPKYKNRSVSISVTL